MTNIKAFIKSHPVISYFALTFVISWGGILFVVGPSGISGTKEHSEMLMPFVILAMLLGPSLAGILLTGLLYGRAGLHNLLTRMTRWRVGARWYAVALLTAPLLFTAVLLALSLTSPEFLPSILTTSEKATLLLMGIAYGLVAGFFEELGWTGFAIPKLLARHGILATGLIVGLMWAAWHLLVMFWASGATSGELSLASYLIDPFLFLVVFRVLMVWVYDRTNGSLLVAMLMHVSLTASSVILGPFGPGARAGVPLLTFDLTWAAVLWVVVAAIAVVGGGHLSREPLRRRVA